MRHTPRPARNGQPGRGWRTCNLLHVRRVQRCQRFGVGPERPQGVEDDPAQVQRDAHPYRVARHEHLHKRRGTVRSPSPPASLKRTGWQGEQGKVWEALGSGVAVVWWGGWWVLQGQPGGGSHLCAVPLSTPLRTTCHTALVDEGASSGSRSVS